MQLKSGLSITDCNIFSRIPRSLPLINYLCVFFQSPYSFGKSRNGAPILKIQNTALIKRRLSMSLLPVCSTLPGRFTLILSQFSSLISFLRNTCIFLLGYYPNYSITASLMTASNKELLYSPGRLDSPLHPIAHIAFFEGFALKTQ